MFNQTLIMNLKIVLYFYLLFGAVYSSSYFDVELTEGRYVNGTGEVNFGGIKVKRVNKTLYGASGNLEVTTNIDDSFEVSESFLKKQGNEYRMTAFHVGPYKFCDYIQNQSLVYDGLLSCSNLPQKKDCPWTKGTFNLNQCLFPTNQIPRYFNEGEYRIDVTVTKGGEISGAYQAFFYVVKDDS